MFVQIIEGIVRDRDLLQAQMERWRTDVKPGAVGFLGSTSGITDDGVAIVAARFTSAEQARQNSDRPEQSQWWEQTAPAFEGEIEFLDCDDVDAIFGGGSDQAGFVQVIEGRAKDPAAMKSQGAAMEDALRATRPDILGGLIAWHPDRGFTQIVYFTSEADARAAEAAPRGDEQDAQWAEQLDGPLSFLDLRAPVFD
jgi:hypothetical protein